MEELGEDMLMEILSRLRVKELVKLKSVCKRWFAIISSNSFIHLHLQKPSFTAVWAPVSCAVPYKAEFVGSCDGLVCLLIGTHDTVAICNPALYQRRKLVVTLPSPIIEDGVKCCWFGHGDSNGHHDHHKMIIGTTSHMYIISLYSDSDQTYHRLSMQEFNKLYCFDEKLGTLFQNSVYWPASLMVRPYTIAEPQVPIIVSYDLGNGTTGELAPPQTNHHHILSFVLGEVNGCLSTLIHVGNQNYQLWAMKQHGVPESWTMLIDFPSRVPARIVTLDFPCVPTWLRSPLAIIRTPFYGKHFWVESLVSLGLKRCI